MKSSLQYLTTGIAYFSLALAPLSADANMDYSKKYKFNEPQSKKRQIRQENEPVIVIGLPFNPLEKNLDLPILDEVEVIALKPKRPSPSYFPTPEKLKEMNANKLNTLKQEPTLAPPRKLTPKKDSGILEIKVEVEIR